MGTRKQHKHVPTKTKLKKDPGVPKLPDLKQKKNAEKLRAVQRTVQLYTKDPDAAMASEPTLSSLAALADESAKNSSFDLLNNVSDPSSSTSVYKAQLRKQYIRTLHRVIEESDIIILVLDARDPEGCRSRLVEEEVRRREHEGKRLVFVLNKVDLVPRSNAEAWLRHLRHSTPTLPFKSSTQQQRSNLTSHTAPALLNLLKGYKRGAKAGSVTVGVVGYPNVGKSSLINSLKRAKVCAVAAEAGHTKEMQTVQVERGVRVLDSPGVVFDDDEQESSNILLRNVLKVEDIADPIAVVEQIILKTDMAKLQEIYKIPQFSSPLEFLTMIALSTGRLLKGGTPDILAAARQVIQDWNAQKIPYFSVPPTIHPSSVPTTVNATTSAKYGIGTGEGPSIAPGAENVGDVQIVSSFAPEFDMGDLFKQADVGAFSEVADQDMTDPGEIDQEAPMESDDLTPSVPRKRGRSESPAPSEASRIFSAVPPEAGQEAPPSKRTKKELPTYDTTEHEKQISGLARHNPLNRRSLKNDSKKARKAERKRARLASGDNKGGMEIDDEGASLSFTFMA